MHEDVACEDEEDVERVCGAGKFAETEDDGAQGVCGLPASTEELSGGGGGFKGEAEPRRGGGEVAFFLESGDGAGAGVCAVVGVAIAAAGWEREIECCGPRAGSEERVLRKCRELVSRVRERILNRSIRKGRLKIKRRALLRGGTATRNKREHKLLQFKTVAGDTSRCSGPDVFGDCCPIVSSEQGMRRAKRRCDGGERNVEWRMASRTWKYAKVARMKPATITSIGFPAARAARGRKIARMFRVVCRGSDGDGEGKRK